MRGKKVLRWIGIIFSILLPLLSISIPLNNYAAEVKEKENRIISARLKGTVSVNGTEMSPLILKDSKEGLENLRVLLEKKEIHAVMYLADTLQVISFDVEGEKVSGILRSGDEFLLQGVQMADDKSLWFHIKTVKSFNVIEGLIPAQYAACVDPDFLSWKNRYIESEFASTDREENLFSIQSAEKIYPDVETFPDSYKSILKVLKEQHPNWIFVKMDTKIDWQELINSQVGERSLIYDTSLEEWKNGTYGTNWAYASEAAIKYFIDPRNWLTEKDIFQFELLGYSQEYHTVEAVGTILANTFMENGILENGMSYAWNFVEIGKKLNISPFLMASRVRQEQGTKGTSALISGTYQGYEGYYNYYNIGASGKTDREIITSGLENAKQKGWDTRLKSLEGGASFLGNSYINAGQDTLYLQKFDVDDRNHGVFWHQYMQNIQAPSTEAVKVYQAYKAAGLLQEAFIFRIPTYSNMPVGKVPLPGEEEQEHNCGEWTIDRAPDCVTSGQKSRYCEVCDKTEIVTLNPAGHRYETAKIVEPTEKNSGYREVICSVCSHTYSMEIRKYPANHKHKYEITLLREPTSTETGLLSYTCYCKESYREIIPKLP